MTERSRDLVFYRNDLFERRQEGDYIDFVSFEESEVQQWLSKAEQFIGHIEGLVESETK